MGFNSSRYSSSSELFQNNSNGFSTRLHLECVAQCCYTVPRLNWSLFTFLFQICVLHNRSKALGGLNSAHCVILTVGTSSAVLETLLFACLQCLLLKSCHHCFYGPPSLKTNMMVKVMLSTKICIQGQKDKELKQEGKRLKLEFKILMAKRPDFSLKPSKISGCMIS